MAFTMKFDNSKLKGIEPVPANVYRVRFDGFKPKFAKLKEGQTVPSSINLNGEVTIIDNPEFENRKLFVSLNDSIPSFIQDFCHSFGVPFTIDADGDPSFPGIFDADPSTYNPNDPTTWKYAGPLVGQTASWEVGVGEYQGRPNQSIRRFVCSIPGCAETYPEVRHSNDMARKG